MFYIITGIGALVVGLLVGYLVRQQVGNNRANSAEQRAEKMLSEAKTKEGEIILKAKESALKILDEAKRDEDSRRRDLKEHQIRLEKREALFDQKLLELQEKHQKLQDKATQIEQIKIEIQKIKDAHQEKLEEISGLSRESARELLLEKVEKDAQEDIMARIEKVQKLGAEDVAVYARGIVADAMSRCAMSVISENTTTSIALSSDEMKGRIIGKEGRNIRTIESLTGVDIIIDDTPQTITLSGFSMIRRQVAKLAIEKLLKDGRIHPGRIEEYVEQAKQELAGEIKKAGEDSIFAMGVTGLDPKLVQILGRLKFRSSFGQNALVHSMEVAYLSSFLAAELGADVNICKKGGLLHDIGKAVDHEVQGGHPQIGYEILKKFNMPEEIAYQCIAHHEDAPRTLEGIVVKIADAISASRPGARSDSAERYLQRISELENLALSFPGVEKAYAIQAGREIRVFVSPDEVDDLRAYNTAKSIAKKIEDDLNYPGDLKVTLIREKRIIEYAH
ncbi:MAG: ribonuclease Y [Candidatus Uhrbacteria bacterium]|nr:ribonuclease Y [Candidatus Uhrbacteria bacterium]